MKKILVKFSSIVVVLSMTVSAVAAANFYLIVMKDGANEDSCYQQICSITGTKNCNRITNFVVRSKLSSSALRQIETLSCVMAVELERDNTTN